MASFLDPLIATPLPDGKQWCVYRRLRYLSDVGVGVATTITVNPGFVTDYASIPQELWAILPPWGRYGPASVLHDWGYWQQTLTRQQCDDVLREASLLLGVEDAIVSTIYNAVRLFGQTAWDRNTALRASGYQRMVTGPDTPPYSGIPS